MSTGQHREQGAKERRGENNPSSKQTFVILGAAAILKQVRDYTNGPYLYQLIVLNSFNTLKALVEVAERIS